MACAREREGGQQGGVGRPRSSRRQRRGDANVAIEFGVTSVGGVPLVDFLEADGSDLRGIFHFWSRSFYLILSQTHVK
jgi:hypothetical protein